MAAVRLSIYMTGPSDEATFTATRRKVLAALSAAGFSPVEPPKPPRHLTVIRGGGDQQ